ncbi:N-acetylmuramoyl-L-alanine amidase [Streptomyces sp. SID12501]|uniref:N-acetylmuramoyl-L-alanine amidase n=1 Tax=Streptomyces sp. SID12501 TaxID=2706042 RepID=A0A6B3C251_9ACTN|nr:N-acetylmuramoyl-L-alanine amidase [Streptomyces sp. SID12501]NEC90482.1 N-acetylmuramoyl-L-alanine amidase [Streptomyces sp. SID12501]
MAWYPGATRMELQPESDDQAAIRPTQLIVHSLAASWTAERTYEYWHDSTNLESHFGLGYAGDLAQYIGTQTRADANASANLRPDGTGAISIETASNLHATDEWTDEQVEKLIRVGAWAHQHPAHAIPLRLCRSADDPGFGWHAQYNAWNPNGHACPGPARIAQFKTVVFPGIVARATGTTTPEEDDVALTDADIDKVAVATVNKLLKGGALETSDVERIAKAVAARPATLTDAQVQALATNPALAEAIAEKVAAKLAARLAN